jgi:hypothetical protein
MKPRSFALPFVPGEADRHKLPPPHVSEAPPPPRTYPRLSPITAMIVAVAALALCSERANDRLGLQLGKQTAVSPAEAVDISLQRLGRSRVVARFQRGNRLNGSPKSNRKTIDGELGRIRAHPLYATIKERMTEHLRNKGFDRITINNTLDAIDPMVSIDAEITLHRFIHTLRASFPAPNGTVAAFLNEQEKIFGTSIVEHRGDGHYDVAVTLLIQLLFEYPEGIAPVAGAVKLVPRSSQDIEQDFLGGGASGCRHKTG